MDDLVELTRFRETEVGPQQTTHRTYQGQNRWQSETWIKSRELGSGSYGVVWLEEEVQSHRVRAVKRVRKKSYAWDEKTEIAAMARVRQFPQHFAYLHGWYESQDWIFLAMDYFEMGDLSHHLQSKIPESQARDITQQLLRGLVEMHGMGITHRDLKPTNIFVVARSASSWDVRIGDFGIAKRVNANETELRTITGTRCYMAPELDPMLVDDEETHTYTQAVDVWALGILLFQMLTLQMAFQDQSSLRKYFKGRTAFPDESLLRESITSPCIELLMAVLQPKPKDRPASGDTFSYKWMKASSSDSDLAPVRTLLSELRVAPDGRAVGGCIDTRKHKSNGSSIFAGVPKVSRWAKATTSAVGPDLTGVWQQPPGYKCLLQMPSVPVTQGVAAEDPSQTLSAMRPSILNAVLRQMTDGAPDVSPSYKEQRARPEDSSLSSEDSSLDPEAARRFYWNLGTMTRSAPHIRERPLLRQSQHPTEHRTDPRRYPPYTRDDAGSEKYQPGSLPSVPNVRLTVLSVDGLSKLSFFLPIYPDPVATVTVDGKQKCHTHHLKSTLNPAWYESFDLRVTGESNITVQVFDMQQSKDKLLGVVTVRVGNVIDLAVGGVEIITRDLGNLKMKSNVKPKLTLSLSTKLKAPVP